MNKISIIARLTFREAIRRRIVLTGLILGLIFLVIFSIGFHMIYSTILIEANDGGANVMSRVWQAESANFLLMAGLYAVAFLSVTMGALLSADTLAGEISSGTIQTIVTKPIRRSDVVLGKWLGFAGLLGLYSVLMSGGIVLSIYLQAGYVANNLLAGLSLIYLEALLVMTVALACSSAMPAWRPAALSLACMDWLSSAAGSNKLAPSSATRLRCRWASLPACLSPLKPSGAAPRLKCRPPSAPPCK